MDSLKNRYDELRRDRSGVAPSELYEVCLGIARIYFYDHNSEESLQWIDSASQIQRLDSARIVRLISIKGSLLSDFNRRDDGIPLLLESERLALKHGYKSEYARALSSLGCVYLEQSDYESAIPKVYKALEVKRSLDEDLLVPYVNLGVLHYKLSNYKVALRYWTLADSLSDIDNPDVRINMAICQIELGNCEQGKRILLAELPKQYSIREKDNQLASAFYSLGYAELKESKPTTARTYFKRAIKYAAKGKAYKFVSDSYNYLAKSFLPEHPDSALMAVMSGKNIAMENGFSLELLVSYEVLASIYKIQKNRTVQSYYQRLMIKQKKNVHPVRLSLLLSLRKAEEEECMLTLSIESRSHP